MIFLTNYKLKNYKYKILIAFNYFMCIIIEKGDFEDMIEYHFDIKSSKEYEFFIANYLDALGISSEDLVAEIKKEIPPRCFCRFVDVYPTSLKNAKSKEEIAEYYNICYNTLSSSVSDVLNVLLKYSPDFYKLYNKKAETSNLINKNQELIEFYGTDDIYFIKKVMSFFSFEASGMLLLYCPLIKKNGLSIDSISNYINLSSTCTRKLIEGYSLSFKERIAELKVDNSMEIEIKKLISLFDSQIDKKIILMIFGLLDGKRYSINVVSEKLDIDEDYIKNVLVNLSNLLHGNEKKSHNL